MLYFKQVLTNPFTASEINNILQQEGTNLKLKVNTFNFNGMMLSQPIGKLTTNQEEDIDTDDGNIFLQSQTIVPYDGDFKTALQQTILKYLRELDTLIEDDSQDMDDEDYFDNIPAHIDQVMQFLKLIEMLGLFTEQEYKEYYDRVGKAITKLNSFNTTEEAYPYDDFENFQVYEEYRNNPMYNSIHLCSLD